MKGIKKIAVIGPESTGKSTLSEALAKELNTVWVPEYAREFLLQLGRDYTEADLLEIARGQIAAEEKQLRAANLYLICDTDLHVIKVWAEAKYGRCHPWILEQIAARQYDMYLLTGIDMPWVHDPLREHPLPEERLYFYHIYNDIVAQSGIPWAAINGDIAERNRLALAAVQKV